MSICVVTGGQCQCQPENGYPCPAVEELARDAARYRWAEDRMEVRSLQMMRGPNRMVLGFRAGYDVENTSNTDPSSGWTDPKYFEAAKTKVRNFIDAAIAKATKGETP